MTVEYRRVKTLKAASALYCPTCGTLWHACQPYWPLSSTKALHERGSGHKPFYVAHVWPIEGTS